MKIIIDRVISAINKGENRTSVTLTGTINFAVIHEKERFPRLENFKVTCNDVPEAFDKLHEIYTRVSEGWIQCPTK